MVLIGLFLLASWLEASQNPTLSHMPVVKDWTVEDGLPMNSIDGLQLDSRGYLWVTMQEGLARFDGGHFLMLETRLEESGELVSFAGVPIGTSVAPDGQVVLGTLNQGLFLVQEFVLSPLVKKEQLYQGQISDMTFTQEHLWVSTFNQGVFVLSWPECEIVHRLNTATGLHTDDWRSILNVNDQIWVLGRKGLIIIDSQSFNVTPFSGENGMPDSNVYDIIANGLTFLVATSSGVFQFDPKEKTFTPTTLQLPGRVFRLVRDGMGRLWLGSERGLWFLHDQKAYAFPGLEDVWIDDMLLDQNGSLWLATRGMGLYQLRFPLPLRSFQQEFNLAPVNTWSVCQTLDGALWMATEGQGVIRLFEGKTRSFSVPEGLPSPYCYSVFPADHNSVWVGTENGLARVFPVEETCSVIEGAGLANVLVIALRTTREGRLWVGTEGKGCLVQKGDEWLGFDKSNGLTGSMVVAFAETADGTVLVGHENGIDRIKNDEVQPSTRPLFPFRGGVNGLLVGPEDEIWVTTNSLGLCVVTSEGGYTLSTKDGLRSNAGLSLILDPFDRLWLSSNRGVAVMNREEALETARLRHRPLSVRYFDAEDGLITGECNGGVSPSIWLSRQGECLLPNVFGISAIPSGVVPPKAEAPLPILERCRLDDQDWPLVSPVHLPPGTTKVELFFSLPELRSPTWRQFQWRLEGFQEDWVKGAHHTQSVVYYNLEPKTYRFQLQARNGQGQWSSSPVTLVLRQMPLWRQRPLFWVVGVLGALLAAYGLVLLRTGQLKRREMRLTQLVNEKTRVLQETAVMTQRQAGELTRLNRQLQKTNADLSMAMQQKQEFLSVIAHDLKNPLHAIKGFSELLLLPRSDLSQARAYATTIASEAMKMSHLLDELVESGRLESNLAHLLVRDENLALILQQTVAVFLPLAEKKQQTIRYMGPDHLPIVGDRTVLERVFQNLLSNAVKYSPHSSCIDVFLRLTDQAIECGVQDEGPGIAPADRDRLFVKFAKLSNQPTGGETSHGIGLYITKLLVELHSGQIQMLPVEPSGCCFQISLPAQGCWLKPPEDHGPGGITKDQIEENNREGD